MWCDKCKKEVDINSVAVNKPQAAFSMDVEGDVTPTMIHSTSNIINICKSCGESDYLFDSEASARREGERQKAQRERDKENNLMKEKVWGTGFFISFVFGLGLGIYGAVISLDGQPDWSFLERTFWAVAFGLCGMVIGLAVTWACANFTGE